MASPVLCDVFGQSFGLPFGPAQAARFAPSISFGRRYLGIVCAFSLRVYGYGILAVHLLSFAYAPISGQCA
jgi:hypothetical protein